MEKQQKQFNNIMSEYIKNHPLRIDTATRIFKGPDSIAFYKQLSDSLQKKVPVKNNELKIIYKDTCTSAPMQYEQGFEFGYQVGQAEGKAMANIRVDTVVKTIVETGRIDILKKENEDLKLTNFNSSLQKQKIKTRAERFFWLLIISAVLNLFFIVLLTKKYLK